MLLVRPTKSFKISLEIQMVQNPRQIGRISTKQFVTKQFMQAVLQKVFSDIPGIGTAPIIIFTKYVYNAIRSLWWSVFLVIEIEWQP